MTAPRSAYSARLRYKTPNRSLEGVSVFGLSGKCCDGRDASLVKSGGRCSGKPRTHLKQDKLEFAREKFLRLPLDFEVDYDFDCVVPSHGVILERDVFGPSLVRVIDSHDRESAQWRWRFRRSGGRWGSYSIGGGGRKIVAMVNAVDGGRGCRGRSVDGRERR